MSGVKGAIRKISEDFNEIPLNKTIEGIKTAGLMENRIKAAEIERQTMEQEAEEKVAINPDSIVQEIKDDMVR